MHSPPRGVTPSLPTLIEDIGVNLRKLSLKQLDDLSNKIEVRRTQLKRQNAGAVRQQIEAMVRSAGLKLADVIGAPAPRAASPAPAVAAAPSVNGKRRPGRPRKAAAAAAPAATKPTGKRRGRKPGAAKAAVPAGRAVKGVTYANPKDAKQTWRGFGKRPGWFLAAVASGKSEKDLRASK